MPRPSPLDRLNEGLGRGMSLYAALEEAQRKRAAAAPVDIPGIGEVPTSEAPQYKLAMMKLGMERQKSNKMDLSAEQTKRIMDVSQSAKGLAGVGQSFQQKGLSNDPLFMGRIAKSLPLVGQGGMLSAPLNAMMPKSTQYLNTMRQQVESDLRAATGATAPPSEVETYVSFMPQIGDSPQIASEKLKDYQNKIKNKALGVADSLEISGDMAGAQQMRMNIEKMFAGSGLDEAIQGFGPTALPTTQNEIDTLTRIRQRRVNAPKR